MEDLSETTRLASMADGASLEQVGCFVVFNIVLVCWKTQNFDFSSKLNIIKLANRIIIVLL